MKWGLFKASRLLQLIKEKDSKVMEKASEISIINDNRFYMKEDMLGYTISISLNKPIGLSEWFDRYFNLQDQSDYMFNDFYQCFSFIHEIGHIVNNEGCDKVSELQSFYNGTYSTEYEEYEAYRNLPKEKMADEYALNFIRKNKVEIYMLMNNMTREQAQSEVDFWSSL